MIRRLPGVGLWLQPRSRASARPTHAEQSPTRTAACRARSAVPHQWARPRPEPGSFRSRAHLGGPVRSPLHRSSAIPRSSSSCADLRPHFRRTSADTAGEDQHVWVVHRGQISAHAPPILQQNASIANSAVSFPVPRLPQQIAHIVRDPRNALEPAGAVEHLQQQRRRFTSGA